MPQLSVSPRRTCPSCGRSVAVVAGKFVRHDPRTHRGAELVLCAGSKQRAPLDASQRPLDGYDLPPTPGQLPVF
ncbi:hypothetical protein [Streptomyces sp. NPDC048361]|uniref:hypothetical protein n=1 Tax=Streptomyces sp. NPDC048361 TaxID=3154720 RepID=UPI003429AAE9